MTRALSTLKSIWDLCILHNYYKQITAYGYRGEEGMSEVAYLHVLWSVITGHCLTCNLTHKKNIIYYPPEVRGGRYWRLGVFLLQYFPLFSIY